ncbi:MAG: hypothetical protein ACRDD8_08245 [Bacteroidales bacterium]
MNRDDAFMLSKAISYYEEKGYTFIELDWTVPKEISAVTKPDGKRDFTVGDKVLVGSGEQSFIDKMTRGELEYEKFYMGITPCFRDDVLDTLHQQYFTKLELFGVSKSNMYKYMLDDALELHSNVLKKDVTTKFINDNSMDIVLSDSGVELGSYIKHKTYINDIEYCWSCGTGLALPRIYVK